MAFQRDIELCNQLREKNPKVRVADLGCGRGKLGGAWGFDVRPHYGVDAICDLDRLPWPIKDNSLDLLLFNNIIEHMQDIIRTMGEIHRIVDQDGVVVIRTPHFSHPESFRDPTHRWHLTWESLDYFLDGNQKLGLYADFSFRVLHKELIFGKGFGGRLGRLLANISVRRYEKYHCHHYPSNGLYFQLQVIK